MKFFKYVPVVLLLSSCSLISVNTCHNQDDSSYVDVTAKDWDECVAVCHARKQAASGGIIITEDYPPASTYMCVCSDWKHE
jgi:hypothetical protein